MACGCVYKPFLRFELLAEVTNQKLYLYPFRQSEPVACSTVSPSLSVSSYPHIHTHTHTHIPHTHTHIHTHIHKHTSAHIHTQHHSAEVLKWEESKRWQKRVEGLKSKLSEKNRELEAAQKQINSLKEMLSRSVLTHIIYSNLALPPSCWCGYHHGDNLVSSQRQFAVITPSLCVHYKYFCITSDLLLNWRRKILVIYAVLGTSRHFNFSVNTPNMATISLQSW